MPTAVVRLVLACTFRLPPGSELRRRLLKRGFARGFEATRRDDYQFALLMYEPEVEHRMFGENARALGLAERYHGHRGFLDMWRDYKKDMDDLHFETEQIIDFGDLIALRASLVGRGRSSSVATTRTAGLLYYFSPRGMIARSDVYWTWEEALAALER
jgi:SnoaL-like domain